MLCCAVRIGILGSGAVGQAPARGDARHGHEVRTGTRPAAAGVVEGVPTGTPQAKAAVTALLEQTGWGRAFRLLRTA